MKKVLSVFLVFIMLVSSVLCMAPGEAQAAAIQISAKQVLMSRGQSYTLKLKNAKKVKWSSSKKTVATVKNGKVKVKKQGKTTITAKSGKKNYKCIVNVTSGERKTLVIYFSATGKTKTVAEKVSKMAGADIIRLVPKKAYSSADLNYNKACRANREQEKNAKPAIDTTIKNLKQYDTVFLGYPIWWSKEPGVIRTLLSKTKLTGKNIIPFCTSGGSGISGSMPHIRKLASGATVKNGKDLTDVSDDEIKEWVDKNLQTETPVTDTPQPEVTQTPATDTTSQPEVTQIPASEGSQPSVTATPPAVELKDSKIIVAYFSQTGTTKSVADKINGIVGGEIYEITAKIPYTSEDLNYNDRNTRATVEQNDSSSRPEIGSEKISFENCKVLYLGYPIWWGQAPRIMDTFVESYDFTGITVIPFCTSGSSPIGSSATRLSSLAGTGTWLEGHRFSSGASESDIKSWIEGLSY